MLLALLLLLRGGTRLGAVGQSIILDSRRLATEEVEQLAGAHDDRVVAPATTLCARARILEWQLRSTTKRACSSGLLFVLAICGVAHVVILVVAGHVAGLVGDQTIEFRVGSMLVIIRDILDRRGPVRHTVRERVCESAADILTRHPPRPVLRLPSCRARFQRNWLTGGGVLIFAG